MLSALARMEANVLACVGQAVDCLLQTMVGGSRAETSMQPRCLDVVISRSYTSHLGNQLHNKYIKDAMAEYNQLGSTTMQDLNAKNVITQRIIVRVESAGGRYLEVTSGGTIVVASRGKKFDRVRNRLTVQKNRSKAVKPVQKNRSKAANSTALLLQTIIRSSNDSVVASASSNQSEPE